MATKKTKAVIGSILLSALLAGADVKAESSLDSFNGRIINTHVQDDIVTTFVKSDAKSNRVQVYSIHGKSTNHRAPSASECGKLSGSDIVPMGSAFIACNTFQVFPSYQMAKKQPLPRAFFTNDNSLILQEATVWGVVSRRLLVTGLGIEAWSISDIDRTVEMLNAMERVRQFIGDKPPHHMNGAAHQTDKIVKPEAGSKATGSKATPKPVQASPAQ